MVIINYIEKKIEMMMMVMKNVIVYVEEIISFVIV